MISLDRLLHMEVNEETIKEHFVISSNDPKQNLSRTVWKRSRINPDIIVRSHDICQCPNCGNPRKEPGHGVKMRCKCGAKVVCHGNGLDVEIVKRKIIKP